MIQSLMRKMNKNEKGFTLVELMVVVAILGVLVAIAIPVYQNVTETAKQNADAANARTINGAIEVYRASTGALPVDGAISANTHVLISGNYLKEVPEDPYGGTRNYTIASGSVAVLGAP